MAVINHVPQATSTPTARTPSPAAATEKQREVEDVIDFVGELLVLGQ